MFVQCNKTEFFNQIPRGKELKMYVTPEQIQAANKANVETFLAVANAQFAAFEKLANISAGAVKTAFED